MTAPTPLSALRAFLLDMDGTICLGEEPTGGAVPFVQYLRASGRRSGIAAVLVLSGEATRAEAEALESPPEYVFESVAQLRQALEAADTAPQAGDGPPSTV